MFYRSVFLSLLFLALPMSAYAALININTANATLLDTLPGIGASKAQAIVDYRTQNGLFSRIEDIQKVSGIGNGVTYANIASLITVGDTGTPVTDTSVASSTPSTPAAASAPTYVPPPSAISLELGGSTSAVLEVPLRLTARVTTKSGGVDSLALVHWSFGDGSSGEGTVVEKTYRYAGTYLVVATATDGDARAQDEITVVVKPAIARVVSISSEGITLANDSSERLNLSGWRILAGGGAFRIPDGMILLPGASILLPTTITNLPIGLDATLLFPDGVVAARYTPTAQPAVAEEGYKQVGEVATQAEAASPIISTQANAPHAEAVLAPAETANPVSAGAPSPTDVPAQTAAVANAPASGIFHSPWTLSLLGVILLAGGAFIFI